MKRSVLGIFAVIVFSLFGGLFLKQDASAYWTNKDGKQCFAVQYSYGKAYNNEGKSVSDGNGDSQRIEAKAYSTKVVCAKVDSSGKATKATVSSSPNDTTFISDDLGVKLSVINNGKTIRSVYCKKPGKACDSGQSKVINDYDLSSGTFASIANSAVSKAPNSYGNAKKRGLKENVTNASVKKEVEEDLAKQKDSANGANSGDPCYSINANSLGWIMCPVMRTLEGFATWLDNQVEGWLSVDTSLYNASSPTASVWEIMRNIANIIMVIILLVIIFSQLTGVGIDNYGIKKMLPRLIAMAILINLSLIVCELAIDLSNLLGTGLRNLFGSIGEGLLNEKGTADLMGNFISTMVSALLAMVAGIGAVAPVGLTVVSIGFSGGIMILVVAILSLLVVGAAVLLFFVMLGARMVIIIGCVAVAPVALAFYILPNTQDLYKKWFTAFKTALVLFPICGAVSGIGWIIRAIVLSADEIQVWMGVIGIIAPFLAFFMLPSMLRGVLGTLGKVGEALTTMGQGVRRGASGIRETAQNTERYKNAMADRKEVADHIRAQRVHDRLSGRTNLTDRQLRQLRRSEDTMVEYETNRLKDRAAGNATNYEARIAGMQAKAREDELDNEVALLKRNGVGMERADGTMDYQQFGIRSIENRLSQLRNRDTLNAEEQHEVGVLTRAALGESGGGGVIGGAIRGNQEGDDAPFQGETNSAFMSAMGNALHNDSTSRAKLAEKDAAASVFAESFMPNGSNSGIGPTTTFNQFAETHGDDINSRINTYEAGLNQSGAALEEYINHLTPQQCQDIYDTEAYKVLSSGDLATFRRHAENNRIYGKSVQRVSLENGNRRSDRSGMNINGPGGGADSIPE